MTRRDLLATVLVPLAGCGYKLAGKGDTLPQAARTIAIPPFTNTSTRYRLTYRLPNQIAREFIARTRFTVVQDLNEADMILRGTVLNVIAFPTTLDPATGRAAAVEILVSLAISLRERVSNQLLYDSPGFNYRERYEISLDPAVYFDESSTAFERVTMDVARSVVSAVLENF
jgi:hypothetical protein